MWNVVASSLVVVVLLWSCGNPAAAAATPKQQQRKVQQQQVSRAVTLYNEAGVSVDVFWVNPQNGGIHRMLEEGEKVVHGGQMPLNSYVGHEFEIHELPDETTGVCGGGGDDAAGGTCRRAIFEVTPYDDQLVYITPNFEPIIEDANTRSQAQAGDLVQECHNQAKRKTPVDPTPADLQKTMLGLVQCVEEKVARNLMHSHEEVAFQESVRKGMAEKLENYTCEDPHHPTSTPLRIESWPGAADGLPRAVHVMHDRPASKIHVVEQFIDDDECRAMEEAARPILHRATVADGAGGSKYSESRKAMQAGIKVPWEDEEAGNPIARLSRRVYDYTNHVLGLGIEEHGQEDLMSIQYFGRGYNDTAPDRYTPHCDGDCTGLPHKHGTRMATMVMYCKIPQHGGHTNFRNAGVHVQPQMGNAIFFSYIDPESKVMDTGFTEHSGCPVFEGEKKIVTQWIRYGVDEENPWDSFNTLGIKKSEEGDY